MWQISPYNPQDIVECPYTSMVTGHYRMKRDYHILRPAGTHDFLIKLTLSGRGLVRHPGGELLLTPGQMLAFQPDCPHDYGTEPRLGRWEMLWVHFRPPRHWLPLLAWPEAAPGLRLLNLPRRTADGRRIVQLFHDLHHVATSNYPRRDWLAMNALESLLLHCDALASRTSAGLDPRLESITEYIHRHLSASLTLEDLAREAHLSVSQLSALFRRHLRVSPQQYVEGRRMELARRLLQFPSISIKEVAAEAGYHDPLYFSKRFRRHTGLCPQDYRDSVTTGAAD